MPDKSEDPQLPLLTLKRRSDFVRLRAGNRLATSLFVLQAMERSDEEGGAVSEQPRFGFTVTRQIGKAVERNRIKRRLKAAAKMVQVAHAKSGFDYVVIARRSVLDSAFGALVRGLAKSLDRIHGSAHSRPQRGRTS